MSGPKKVYDQIDSTEQQLEQNEKKFQKNLQNDQASFEDRLDSLEARLNNEYTSPSISSPLPPLPTDGCCWVLWQY